MAKTVQLASIGIEDKYKNVLEKYNYLKSNLITLQHIILNTSVYSSPYILSITFKKVKGETVLHTLEASDIIVGTGSACNSHSKDQEKTLIYTLSDESLAINTIRISISEKTSFNDLDILIEKIKEIGNK